MSSHAALGVVRAGVAVLKGEYYWRLLGKIMWILADFRDWRKN
jgi:hypothetical protein